MAGGYRSKVDQRKLDQSLDELVKEDELSEREKRKSSRYSPYPDPHKNTRSSRQARRELDSVYVGNLPYNLTEDELRHHMSKGEDNLPYYVCLHLGLQLGR